MFDVAGAKDAARLQRKDEYELVMEDMEDMFIQAQTLGGTIEEEDAVSLFGYDVVAAGMT